MAHEPEEMENSETLQKTRRMNKWENDDLIYQEHIINGMKDSLLIFINFMNPLRFYGIVYRINTWPKMQV